MTGLRFIPVFTLASFLSVLTGCSQPRHANLSEALELYRQNRLEEALPLLKQIAVQDSDNPENHVWLAETYRRLGKKEEAVKSARRALELDPRSSFAHTVIAEASNPVTGDWAGANSDTTWFHLMKAIECDSADGHPWLVIWGESIRRGEHSMAKRALWRLVETGFLTKAALAYGRWMLRGLPENAILITNGDMDTYPPCAVQEVEGLRTDVAIVNRGTLNESWYARYVRDYCRVPLPVDDARLDHLEAYKDDQGEPVTPSDQIFRGWVEQKAKGSLSRPLAVAVTVYKSYWSRIRNNMRQAGAFLEWHDVGTAQKPDTASMRASLEGVGSGSFTGPWVSARDRSPIRRLYTRNIVRNVTVTALTYSESLLEAKRIPEAGRWVRWADELDRTAELGPVFTERISRLKERLAETERKILELHKK
jgi:tetratricopeptide (TPR) repeat protein